MTCALVIDYGYEMFRLADVDVETATTGQLLAVAYRQVAWSATSPGMQGSLRAPSRCWASCGDCITGMSRSGASLGRSVCNVLGIDFGEEEALMAPSAVPS